MSQHFDEAYDVYSETVRKARKQHQCDACKERIPIGVTYCRVFMLFDGEKRSLKRCGRCQKLHQHLRYIGGSDEWPDERLACGHGYKEVWGKDPPEDIAALAFALPGEL